MAVVTLNVNEVVYNAGFAAVGGTVIGVLSDGVNGTYVTNNIAGVAGGIGHVLELGFTNPSLPSGAVIKRVTPKIIASQASGNQRVYWVCRVRKPSAPDSFIYLTPAQQTRPSAVGSTLYTGAAGGVYVKSPDPAHPEWTPQYIASNLRVIINTNADLGSLATGDERISQVTVEVEYDEQPVASAVGFSPSDAPTRTSRPPVVWTSTDPEDSPQAGRRVVIWNAADATDANCPKSAATSFVATNGTTRTAVAYTGTAADPGELTSAAQWTPTSDLPNASYTVFVSTADYVGANVRWADAAGTAQLNFTVNVSLPVAPVLTAPTWDGVNYRVPLVIRSENNLLTADAADNEAGDANSWQAFFNASAVAQHSGTPTPFAGSFARKWTASAAGDSSVTTERYPVVAGKVISGHARVRTSAASRNFQPQIRYWNAVTGGSQVGSSFLGTSVAGNNTGWTVAVANNSTVPVGATHADFLVNALTAGAGETLYVDSAGVYPRTSAPGTQSRGGLVGSQRVVAERSTDGGVTFYPVPPCSGLLPGVALGPDLNQQVTLYDLANRHNTPALYRVKTIHNDGTYDYASPYTANAGPVTPLFDRWVLRDPTDATTSNVIQIAGPLVSESVEEMSIFDVQGVALPGIVSSGVVGGEHWSSVPLLIRSEPAWLLFQLLRSRAAPMILQSDMDGVAWWVRFGPGRNQELLYSTDRKPAATRPRMVTVELYQSSGPYGQPTFGPP